MGVRSAVATPIIVEGRLWGVMVAGSTLEQLLPADTEARLACAGLLQCHGNDPSGELGLADRREHLVRGQPTRHQHTILSAIPALPLAGSPAGCLP